MSDPLAALAAAVGEGEAWLVGGAVRDRLLGRATADLDAVVARAAPRDVARAVGRAAGGYAFELSERFGAWRVVARDHRWQLDLLELEGPVEEDLARRDLTVNAIAQRLGDDALLDPFGGVSDIEAGRLRMVSPGAFADDPLRVLRVARLAAQLGFAVESETLAAARRSAAGLRAVAVERVYAELKGILCGPAPVRGLALMDDAGATAVVLPELCALDGVTQSAYHHLDVAGHTRAVLAETVSLLADPGRACAREQDADALAAALSQPLAEDLTRGDALRFGALLHDIAKPQTRAITEAGRVTFMGHDVAGAALATEILSRLRASERLRTQVAALTRHHLRLGFLVHERPLSRRAVYDYLTTCAPVALDVTVLSVADRLATRGRNAHAAIAAHTELAGEMIGEALAFAADPPRAPVRGDELVAALGRPPGPWLSATLAELQARAWTGELRGRRAAIAAARTLAANQ